MAGRAKQNRALWAISRRSLGKAQVLTESLTQGNKTIKSAFQGNHPGNCRGLGEQRIRGKCGREEPSQRLLEQPGQEMTVFSCLEMVLL